MRPIFGSVVGFVAVALVGCVTTAPLFKLKAIDREKTTRQYVGKEHVLAVSMSFSDFFGDSSRLFVDARPFEIVKLYHQSGEATVVGVPSESVIPAGTPVRVKEIIFPADPLMAPFESGRPALAPTAHPWLVLERTAGDASALPLVVVLPREVASYDEMTQAIDKVLKSQQWVTVWLTQRGPLELDAIYRKKPMEGMTWPALLAALGEPGNIGDYALGEMMDFVADYGDLQITVQGNVVKSIVSKKAEAEKAQQHALAEAEKARAEAEQRAAEEAAREAEKQAQVAEAKRIRDEESAKERGTVIEARAAAAAAEEARRDAERQAEEDRKTAEQQRLTKDEEAARREVELKARLEAAERARVAAERDREQKLREAELAKKVVEAEAAALAARQKAEEDAARAQASAVESRRRLQSDLAKTEKDAAAADKKAKGLEAKAAAGQREIDAAQVRLAALEASAKERRKLGLKVASVSPQLASTLGRVDTLGAFVAKVESDGPAERAGVKANDIITAVEKKEVLGPKEFVDLVNEIPADRSVNVEVLRGGKTVTLTFTSELAAALAKEAKALTQITARHRPAIEAAASARTEADVKATAVAAIRQQLAAFVPSEPRKIGVNVEIINPQLASALGLSQGQGAFVRAVQAEGDAERGGLQKNDVVLGVNGAAVAGPDQFRDHVGKAMPFEVIELEVLRKGSRVSLKVPASRWHSSPPPEPGRDRGAAGTARG
jgi:C-terminal processing protease CtpA/Prc